MKRIGMLQLCLLCLIINIHNVVSKTDEFICPKDGRWPHPSDCEKYYTCNTGISVEGWCGSDMSYDPDHQRCDLTKNIECKNGERPSWTPPEGWGQSESVTSYVITKTTSHSHNENNDGDDYDNHEVKKKLRPTKKRKTTVKSITIAPKIASEYVTASISQLVESSDCTFQGNMPDPDNCQYYYACREDLVARIRCPGKQLFDEDSRICHDFRKVFCGNRPVNERGNDPCIGQANGWYADHENQCRSYYLCTEHRKTKMGECLSGAKWNAGKLRCDDPRNILAPCKISFFSFSPIHRFSYIGGLRNNHGISWSHQHYSTILIIFSCLFFVLAS
ncbi:hypothetical protein I4U23_002026 [Adineta vaga]|nr:hypothetical protein I4U23_002026 [Adineta vaga]